MTSFVVLLCLFVSAQCMIEPTRYILSYPTSDNPANVEVITPLEKNYFMLLGDWGAEALENIHVQQAIADKMNAYYNEQAAAGYNLLGVFALGDNFYYTGQNCDREFENHWTKAYGKNLTENIPWLAVYGNHDWGDSDVNAMCAWNATHIKYIDPNTNIPYAANQLNKDKGGCNPSNYYLPDFGYYYTINDLKFELIALEESCHACTDIGGGYGSTFVYENCGGFRIGCDYLKKISNATEELLIERAKVSKASNVLIMQHYPSEAQRLLNLFKNNRNSSNKEQTVWSIFGHSHAQRCQHRDEKGVCDLILSGGGGGCCLDKTLRGFYVIGFDKNGNMIQPLEFNDTRISCQYPCDDSIDMSPEYMIQAGFETCCHTLDVGGLNCQLYDLNRCSEYYPTR